MSFSQLFPLLLTLATSAFAAAVPVNNKANSVGKAQSTSALVDLGYSEYQGTVLGNGVNEYLGIRYAAPPIGNL
jgi:acetylcholinesterase